MEPADQRQDWRWLSGSLRTSPNRRRDTKRPTPCAASPCPRTVPGQAFTRGGSTTTVCGNAARSSKPLHCSTSMPVAQATRSEEHTSELQSLMRISYAVFCLKKKQNNYEQ